MPTSTQLLVTGASGHLARRVIDYLLTMDVGPIIATTRTPHTLSDLSARGVDVRPADFDAPETLLRAFRGATRALLVSTDALERPGQRMAQHAAAIEAMQRVGLEHVTYTSWVNADDSVAAVAPDHLATERALETSKLDFTVLRNCIYSEILLGSLSHAVASGTLVDAKGGGRVAYVTRDDCAVTAAAVLAIPSAGRMTFDVTGPEALSGEEVAAIASGIAGKPVRHQSLPLGEFVDGLMRAGLPETMAQMYASFETAAERGELASVSSAVQDLVGRQPQTVADFLAANRDRFVA